ncbi:hypothetical protein ATK74_0825 [Propionicimonas paludicola]|uniref:Uncharacterized protein n=1 Tax=Propionicimonas paludicola TaxID=185243 RepID=A0A2A9CQ24_9ACTN|nr:hypothetical protein [Propionicimonas paludicola]PFG16291.1 hypothetical protein ATK74_0825 [Propionicimonas paludicola]
MQLTPVGHPAGLTFEPGTILQVRIGNEVYQGTQIEVLRYRNHGGKTVFRLQLVDAILVEDAE